MACQTHVGHVQIAGFGEDGGGGHFRRAAGGEVSMQMTVVSWEFHCFFRSFEIVFFKIMYYIGRAKMFSGKVLFRS
jgi:hypothetical protein